MNFYSQSHHTEMSLFQACTEKCVDANKINIKGETIHHTIYDCM